jgi:protein gp37
MSSIKIKWYDSVLNPFIGCTKCSPSCDYCGGERTAARLSKYPNPEINKKYIGVVDLNGKLTEKISQSSPDSLDIPSCHSRCYLLGGMTDFFTRAFPPRTSAR